MARIPKASGQLQRKSPSRELKKRALIVCEDSVSAPAYFRLLERQLSISSKVLQITIIGQGADPSRVVECAEKIYSDDRAKRRVEGVDGFDAVFCVFDRDAHEQFDAAIARLKTLNSNVFQPIVSVPCFEYWVILHYCDTTAPHTRTGNMSPCDNQIQALKIYSGDYSKGDKTTYQKITPLYATAIENAKKSETAAGGTEFFNPSTQMPILLKYLLDNMKVT